MALTCYIIEWNKEQYAMTIQDKFNTRKLEISKAHSQSVGRVQMGGTIKVKDLIYSAIYDDSSRIKFSYGSNFVLRRLRDNMSQEDFRKLVIDNEVVDYKSENLNLVCTTVVQGRSSTVKKASIHYTKSAEKYILKEGYESYKSKTLSQFQKIKVLNLEKKDFRCLDTKQKVIDFVNSVDWSKVSWLTKDTEDTGLYFYLDEQNRDKIVGLSFSYKGWQGVYIPFRYRGEQIQDPYEIMDILKPLWDILSWYQNLSFDARVFRSMHLSPGKRLREFSIMLQLINPDPHQPKALKDVAHKLLGEDTIELTEILGDKFDAKLVEYIDMDLMTVYACQDSDLLYRCIEKLWDCLTPKQKELLDKDMNVYNMVTIADWNGIPYISKKLERLIQETKKDLNSIEDFIYDWLKRKVLLKAVATVLHKYGVDIKTLTAEQINDFGKTREVRDLANILIKGNRQNIVELGYRVDKLKIIYDILEYPKIVYTKAGALAVGNNLFNILVKYDYQTPVKEFSENLYSCNQKNGIILDKNVLNSKAFPFAYMMQAYIETSTKLKNYIKISQSKNEYQRYFEQYKYCNTVTSRITSVIQTIPKYARDVIGTANDSKYGLVLFDFDQVEVRGSQNAGLMWWNNLLKDGDVPDTLKRLMEHQHIEKIVDAFNSDSKDPYVEQAAISENKPAYKITAGERKTQKSTILGRQYGQTAIKTAEKETQFLSDPDDIKKVIEKYEDAAKKYLGNNIHLVLYMNNLKQLALTKKPIEEKPWNLQCDTFSYVESMFGRRRYFPLDGRLPDYKIVNQALNFPQQAGCRDIVMFAVAKIMNEIWKHISPEDCFAGILVHDECGIFYNKEVVNPLWICALVQTFANIRISGQPIVYTTSPAVVSNWKEGKQDKYAIPSEMLENASIKFEDYKPMKTLFQKDYFYDKIRKFYSKACIEKIKSQQPLTNDGYYDLTDLKIGEDYNFYRTIENHYVGKFNVSERRQVNELLELVYETDKDFKVKLIDSVGNIVTGTLSSLIPSSKEPDELDVSNLFDIDESIFDTEFHEELFMSEDMIDCSINQRKVKRLEAKFTPKKASKQYRNIVSREFVPVINILFDFNEDGIIARQQIDTVMQNLSKFRATPGLGKEICYSYGNKYYNTGLFVSDKLSLTKLDNYITSLRSKL